ncbi:hypothetical protein [Nannocystis punicea]|uniref:Uncharacterized protein n=1 Tax=Nannocystis punicea TaxID=2995304 RepID=A0ABY7HIT3_9BACT|nr:hypothetical protein [Nannocystis poenicansa]WAS99121.1 hypothetical protein O0S08_23585 [Nannocystis poenicansa]
MSAGPAASEIVSPSSGASPVVAGLGGVAVAAGVGLAAGLSVPLSWGLVPGVLVGLGVVALVARRGPGAPDPAVIAALPRARRIALAALILAPAIPLATVAARALAGIVVAYPAALWAAAPALLAAVVLPLLQRTWSQGLVLCALVFGTFAAGAAGARFEAAGAHARGETWGGPILGIHPFQTTAILIDGYGPFDLPINDYVEPDGSKGYGPAELAEALTRDLQKIAELQYAEHGPARAYKAFAEATVVAEDLPEARERLDRPAEAPTEPRLHVTSGGVGRGSRVEFVCPGAANDPRPRKPDAVMERMCPDKYSSEASAGLGLTGRWTGYTEALGQPRLSLARALGWPRERVFGELRAWAWIVLGLSFLAACGPRGRAAAGLSRWGGAVAAIAAVLSILLLVPGLSVQVEAWSRPAEWEAPLALAPWVALLALGSGHAAIAAGPAGAAGGRWRGALARVLPILPALPIMAGTLGLAGSLAAATWWTPELAPPTGPAQPLPLAGVIAGLGEGLHRGSGLAVDVAEGVVAASAVALLVGLLAALLGPVVRFAGSALSPRRPVLAAHAALLAVIVPAALLVLSRMSAGAAALLAPAAAMAWMAGTGLALAVPGGRRWPAIAEHLLAAVIVVVAGQQALAAQANRTMWIALGIGVLITLAGLVLLPRVRSASDSATPGPRP